MPPKKRQDPPIDTPLNLEELFQKFDIEQPKLVQPGVEKKRPSRKLTFEHAIANPLEPIKNFVEGTVEIFKGMGEIAVNIPASIYNTYKEAGETGDSGLVFRRFGDFISEVPAAIVEGVQETYADGILEAMWNKPAYVLLDALTVVSLGAGAAGRSARLAQFFKAGSMEFTLGGKLIQRSSGLAGQLQRMEQSLLALNRLPGKAVTAPFRIGPGKPIGEAIKKMAQPMKDYFGIGKSTRPIIEINASEHVAIPQLLQEDVKRLMLRELGKAEGEAVFRAIVTGNDDLIRVVDTLSNSAKTTFRELRKLQDEFHEKWLIDRTLLDKQQAVNSVAKQVRRFDPEVVAKFPLPVEDISKLTGAAKKAFKEAEEAALKFSRDLITSGKRKPSYLSMFAVVDDPGDLAHRLFGGNEQFWKDSFRGANRLNKRVGLGNYQTDLKIVGPRMIHNFYTLRAKIKSMDRIINHLRKNGELRIVQNGLEAAELTKRGWSIVPTEIWKKYWDSWNRGAAFIVDDIIRNGAGNAERTMEGVLKTILDNSADIVKAEAIMVPKYAANLMRELHSPPGPIGRIYDKMQTYWKMAVTVGSPKYYAATLAGNVVLSLMFGVDPRAILHMSRYKGRWPHRLSSRSQSEAIVKDAAGRNFLTKAANTPGRIVSATDNLMVRKPGVAKLVRQDMKNMRSAASMVEDISDTIRGLSDQGLFDLFIGSVDEVAELISQRQATLERIAGVAKFERRAERISKKLDKKISILTERINSITREIPPSVLEEIPTGVKPRGRIAKNVVKERANLEQRLHSLEQKRGILLTTAIDDIKAAQNIGSQIKKLEPFAESVNSAIRKMNQFAGEYDALHPFARRWFRRAVPFYVFAKAMATLAFRMPFMRPKTTFMWNRISKMYLDMWQDEELPSWIRHYMPMGTDKDGNIIFMRWTGLSPAESVRLGTWEGNLRGPGDIPIPSILDPVSQNPFLKLVFDQRGGWSRDTVQSGEYIVDFYRGEAYQYDNGRIVRAIPQSDFLRTAFNMFPQVQWADMAMNSHVQSKRGWLFHDDPILDADGEPAYPIEFWDGISSIMVARKIRMTPEKLQEQKQRLEVRKLKFVKNAKSMVKRGHMDIETFERIVEDYENQVLRFQQPGEPFPGK